jgi:hypothetical protein
VGALGVTALTAFTALAVLAPPALAADTAESPATQPAAPHPLAWLATSRLGYGPAPTDSPGQITNAKAWALNQLALATQAAAQPARLPDGLSQLVTDVR